MRKKTSLICSECGRPIYSDEGFYTNGKIRHAKSCNNIIGPEDCNKYKGPRNPGQSFHIPYVDNQSMREAGYSFMEPIE